MKPIPAALAAPWAIEPNWLRVVFGVWSRGKIDAAALAHARADWEARKASRPRLEEPGAPVDGTGGVLRIVGNVGVISIEGPLFRHASLMSEISGGTSYDAIWRGLEAALSSRAVNSILLRINSPGGEADGVSELAKGIAASTKPVSAYVDGMCASAAYWLASQADSICAEESAEIGSIGVRSGIIDDSAADEAAGVREIEIISSQSPGKRSRPVNDEVIARLQTRIDDLADIFIAAVARGRGVDADEVLSNFGQGDVMIASKALAAGLIDEIGNFNGTLAELATVTNTARSAKGIMMKKESDAKVAAGAEPPEWQCAGCNEMMGPSAKAYCAKCAEDDGEPDGDEDEDEAKALGMDVKAARADRRTRALALSGFSAKVLEATGAANHEAALAAIADCVTARAEIATVRAEGRSVALRAMLERGIAGAPGKAPTLSLGQIQKHMTSSLRGDAKRAWAAAMDKLAADADAKGVPVSAAEVIDAACSVSITADDLESIQEYVSNSQQVAASTFVEPHRDGKKEAEELDPTAAQVAAGFERARKALDRHVAK